MPSQSQHWTLREWTSRLLAGSAVGSLVLVLFCLLVFPWLGPRVKGRHMWTLCIPEYGLPAAIVLGGLAGLAWRATREVRLSRAWLLGSCLVVALMSQLLRPHISRAWHYGFGPLYEEVPDCLAMAFCLTGLMVLVFDRVTRSSGPKAEPSGWTDGEICLPTGSLKPRSFPHLQLVFPALLG
jgi:hypothetical protein